MSRPGTVGAILAIDIGATTIKLGEVNPDGVLIGAVERRATPYPCTPDRLVDEVAAEIRARRFARVGVGFPGDFGGGVVLEPGNLARPGGFASEVDAAIDDAWRGFNLQDELRRASGRDVRVVNDATLAALGCCEGAGRELVCTLGTGFGIALVVDGAPVRIRDVGAEVYVDGGTYDQLLGEHARAADETRWSQLLRAAAANFAEEFAVGIVHLGGGNARRVDLAWFAGRAFTVVLNDNDASLRGAARLFAT
ncbi:MAG: ROK family protein [Acidimicrobiales bacterium]